MSRFRPLRRKPHSYKKYDYEFRDYPVMDLEAEYLDLFRRLTPNDIRPSVFRAFDLFYDSIVGREYIVGEGVGVEVFTDPDSFSTTLLEVGEAPGDIYCASVVFLAHFDGLDEANTAYELLGNPLTFVGNAQLDTAEKKFGTSSLLLDGTGDWVTAPDSVDWYLPGRFTIECWVKPNVSALSTRGILCHGAAGIGQVYFHLDYVYTSSLQKRFQFIMSPTGFAGDTISVMQAAENIDQSVWHHVAITRDASNLVTLWVDGVQKDAETIVGATDEATDLFIGSANNYGGSPFIGWIDEVRITKDVCRYTSNFTVPSDAFPDACPAREDAYGGNVVLLAHMDGEDNATRLYDHSTYQRSLTVVNSAVLDTAQAKFGPSSLFLNSITAAGTAYDSDSFLFPAEFTIECWARVVNTGATTRGIISHGAGTSALNWKLDFTATSDAARRYRFVYYPDGTSASAVTVQSTAGAIDLSVFHHLAVTRDASNIIRLFVDGVLDGTSAATSGGTNVVASLYLGANPNNANSMQSGWLDEVRITKGVCRYTSSFTVPDRAYPNIVTLPTSGVFLDRYSKGMDTFMSNNELTVTRQSTGNSSQGRSVRANTGKSSGKWVYAIDPVVLGGTLAMMGLCTSAFNTNGYTYISAEGLCLALSGTGDTWNGNTTVAFGGVAVTAAATEVQLAIDFTAGRWWVRNGAGAWNGSPTAGTGGQTIGAALTGDTLYPCISVMPYGDEITCNFGASAFANALPSGFKSWDGSQTG